MSQKISELQSQGIAIDSDSVDQQYIDRTSDDLVFEWAELLAGVETAEFQEKTKGIPPFDPSVEVDEFGDQFDTSENWPFADATASLTTEFEHFVELSRKLACDPSPTYFPIFFRANETLLTEVQSSRTIARLLRADCQVAMFKKDSVRTTEDLVAMFELSKHVDAVPSIVSRFVGIAFRRMALEALQHAIEIDLLTVDQLLQIDRAIERYCDIGDRWKQVILDEMSLNLPVFVTPHLYMDTDMIMPARGHDAVYFIDTMVAASEIRTEDWGRFLDSSSRLMSKFDRDIQSSFAQVDQILSRILIPDYYATATTMINDCQLHRQARVAIAVRMYQHQYGEFPSSLEVLPEAADKFVPFGSKPFGYRKETRGATLWGFQLSDTTKQIPEEPPVTDPAVPNSINNRQIVWVLE
ncbi:hypothetical protein SH467x_000485 [Pirellulaceae bacterium SH467]